MYTPPRIHVHSSTDMKPISATYIFSGVADSLKVKGSGDLVSLAIDCIDSIALHGIVHEHANGMLM